jgi:hypothetical protein
MQHSILAAVLALTLAGTPVAAEVYKWVDAEGNVHYGDRPPSSGQETHSLSLPSAPDRDSDHGERSLKQRRLLEAFEAERAEAQRVETAAAEAKREQAHKCEQARRTLANFERANVVYTTDESGARVYMSDEERRGAAANARAWIGKHCE